MRYEHRANTHGRVLRHQTTKVVFQLVVSVLIVVLQRAHKVFHFVHDDIQVWHFIIRVLLVEVLYLGDFVVVLAQIRRASGAFLIDYPSYEVEYILCSAGVALYMRQVKGLVCGIIGFHVANVDVQFARRHEHTHLSQILEHRPRLTRTRHTCSEERIHLQQVSIPYHTLLVDTRHPRYVYFSIHDVIFLGLPSVGQRHAILASLGQGHVNVPSGTGSGRRGGFPLLVEQTVRHLIRVLYLLS